MQRIFLFLIALTVLIPCSAQDKSNRSQDLSINVVRHIEGKLSCLKQGMSHEDVLQKLDFERFKRLKGLKDSLQSTRLFISTLKDYAIVYKLKKGYDLVLTFDRHHKFRDAEMSGEKWEQEQKSLKKHKRFPPSSPCSRDLPNVAQFKSN